MRCMGLLWTQGDVQAAIDRELAKVDGARVGELPALLQRVRGLGERHSQPQLVSQAIGRVRSMLPAELAQLVAPVEPPVSEPTALRKCDACGFEWKPRAVEGKGEGCAWCQALVVQNRLQSLGVFSDDDLWFGRLAAALPDVDWAPDGSQAASKRLGLLGFEQQLESAELCGCIDVVSRPQVVFEPILLLVPPEVGEGVLVDIRIGNRSFAPSPVPVALSLYKPSAWTSLVAMKEVMLVRSERALVAQDVTLTVALRERGLFRAALLGRTEVPR